MKNSFQNIQKNQTSSSNITDVKTKENIKMNLNKKIEVLEKASLSSKKKYEGEISRNIKEMFKLEKKKEETVKEIKEKINLARHRSGKVNEIYDVNDKMIINENPNYNDNEPRTGNFSKINEQTRKEFIDTNEKIKAYKTDNVLDKKKVKNSKYELDCNKKDEKKTS